MPTQIYKFNNKYATFFKYIDSSEKYKTFSIIWAYNNEYYIIDINNIENTIIINNIFEDEIYYKFEAEKPGYGFVKDNILYITEHSNKYQIGIYNLIEKTKDKFITDIDCKEVIFWNKNYLLCGGYNEIIILDLKNNQIKRKPINNWICYKYIIGLRKVILNEYAECLIIFDSFNNINILGFN